jgi:hypothetical protein
MNGLVGSLVEVDLLEAISIDLRLRALGLCRFRGSCRGTGGLCMSPLPFHLIDYPQISCEFSKKNDCHFYPLIM